MALRIELPCDYKQRLLRACALSGGLSQDDIAEVLGVGSRTVNHWMQHRLEFAAAVADARERVAVALRKGALLPHVNLSARCAPSRVVQR